MSVDRNRIAELEWANYVATRHIAQVTPEIDLVMRDDVVITSSPLFPAPDTNHACLLRTGSETAAGVVQEVVEYFEQRSLPVTVYLSPACSPPDLEQRLIAEGFRLQETCEAWMVLEDLGSFQPPRPSNRVEVRHVVRSEAPIVAQTFMNAFEMPNELAVPMARLLAPSVGLSNVCHYLAWVDGQPVGTCSLLCHGAFGVLGSAGVVPVRRGRRVASSLAVHAIWEAQSRGIETLMLQTAADTMLERFLRISGFERAFTRSCLTLP